MVRLIDRLDMTIVVDWDVTPQIKQNKNLTVNIFFFFYMTPCFRGISVRTFAEKLRESSRCFSANFRGVSPLNIPEKKSSLRELTRNLAEFSP